MSLECSFSFIAIMLGDMFWKSWVGFNLAGNIHTFHNTSGKKKTLHEVKTKSYTIWVILKRKRLFVDNPTTLLFYFCFWRHLFVVAVQLIVKRNPFKQPSQVLCRTKVTSTTTTMAVHYICVSRNQALTKTAWITRKATLKTTYGDVSSISWACQVVAAALSSLMRR